MRFLLTQIASLVVVLLSSGGVASAQIGIIDSSRAHPELPNRHPALPDFTMQQRAAIYSAVMEEKSVPSLSMNMRVGIGTKLPESAELHPLPNAIRAQISAAQKYKYAVWAGEVLLVDPAQRTVSDILRKPP